MTRQPEVDGWKATRDRSFAPPPRKSRLNWKKRMKWMTQLEMDSWNATRDRNCAPLPGKPRLNDCLYLEMDNKRHSSLLYAPPPRKIVLGNTISHYWRFPRGKTTKLFILLVRHNEIPKNYAKSIYKKCHIYEKALTSKIDHQNLKGSIQQVKPPKWTIFIITKTIKKM